MHQFWGFLFKKEKFQFMQYSNKKFRKLQMPTFL